MEFSSFIFLKSMKSTNAPGIHTLSKLPSLPSFIMFLWNKKYRWSNHANHAQLFANKSLAIFFLLINENLCKDKHFFLSIKHFAIFALSLFPFDQGNKQYWLATKNFCVCTLIHETSWFWQIQLWQIRSLKLNGT